MKNRPSLKSILAGGAEEGGVPQPSVLRLRVLTFLFSYFVLRPAENHSTRHSHHSTLNFARSLHNT
jgi:hypothetical protein